MQTGFQTISSGVIRLETSRHPRVRLHFMMCKDIFSYIVWNENDHACLAGYRPLRGALPAKEVSDLTNVFSRVSDDGKDESGRAPSLITHFGGLGGKFLANYRGIDFGLRQATGRRVQEVELPPWARTPADFVARMREALESDHVSKNLHHWIDLVFG